MKICQFGLASLVVLNSAALLAGNKGTGNHFKGKFRVGVEAPLSGDQQTLGEGMLHGAQMAADQINANGGLKHRQVVIVPIDDAATSSAGIEAAKKAVKQQHLRGVIGPYNSGVGIYTLPIYLKHGLLPIRLTSNNSTDGMGYTLQPMSDEIGPMAAEALITWQHAKSVAIIYDQTQLYTSDIASDLKSRLEAAGVVVPGFVGISPGADSYATEVANLAALNPDVIYAATYFPEGGLIARAMFDQHVSARCVADYGSDDPGFIAVAGLDAAKASFVVGVPSPSDFPDGPAFVSEYQNQFGVEPGTWSPYTYDSLNFFADGVRTARTASKKHLKRVLDQVTDWQGVTGSVTIDPATGNRVPATLVILGVSESGQFVINQDWANAVNAPY